VRLYVCVSQIRVQEGLGHLYRGLPAVILGAIPSHAVHFATMEAAKQSLGLNDQYKDGHYPVRAAASGAAAALAHDACVTPADVIKQRLQMWNSSSTGIVDCVRRVIREEGFRAFYASYPTTVLMNVPNTAVTVATYESLKRVISGGRPESASSPLVQWCAGGGAGAIAGAISTPLDVIKTRIQTYDPALYHGRPVHPLRLVRHIWWHEGWRAFTKGMSARVVYNIPSAAICWTTYETVKRLLKGEF
jgi:solute carrier family 25 iron transporter 28/37